MSNGLIVLCDVAILANFLLFAAIFFGDLKRCWFVTFGVILLIGLGLFGILTLGDIAIWLGEDEQQWFMNRQFRAAWRAPLAALLTIINFAFLGVRQRGTTRGA